ncbi:hypothetical protein SAMN06298216_0169 [Spirosomataceae bacterium TFI 002]|nr:hypothetical protein SAMN06298216_0169 [Spirosomataceae bacterium TFI 002]
MNKLLLLVLVFIGYVSKAQEKEYGSYRVHPSWNKTSQLFMYSGKKEVPVKAGWRITESIGSKQIEKTMPFDTTLEVKTYIPIKLSQKIRISDLVHKDDDPSKLYFNMLPFKDSDNVVLKSFNDMFIGEGIKKTTDTLDSKGYILIPENGYVKLSKVFIKWNTITIPFSIRPSINEEISSKVTTGLKIGTSITVDFNWQYFKNRRTKARNSIYGFSTGIAFGLTSISLDKQSTSLLETPYTNSENGLAFFVGPGIGINIKGFQAFYIYGTDIGLTSNVKDWNYNKKWYHGVGVGIGLEVFGKVLD